MRKFLISLVTFMALFLSLVCPVFAAGGDKELDLSSDGLAFIARQSTFHSSASSANGKWYIGYGTACAKDAYPSGIDEQTAKELLRDSLQPHIQSVNQYLAANRLSLEQHQFDALVSFTCSLGSTWTNPSYRLSNYLIKGLSTQTDLEIVDSMAVWCHAGSAVNESYLSRRIDEARLLLYGDYTSKNSPEFYALILDKNGGTLENDTVCYSAQKPYGTLPLVTRSGHQFDGWSTKDGQKLSADTSVSHHVRVSANWTPIDGLTFTDVSKNDWFYSYVNDLSKSGVINGHSPTIFAPDGTVTYGEALKLTLLSASCDVQKPTSTHWASGYLSFGVKQGFLSTSNVNLDAPISRLEIARLAAKTLKLPTVNMASPFSDTSDPSVLALYQAGILQGSQENSTLVYKPNSNINRAEISAIIWRLEQFAQNSNPVPKPEPEPEPEPEPTNKFLYKDKWLDVLPSVPKNPYNPKLFYQSNGFTYYSSNEYSYKTGVDVSSYQGDIDWQKVKESGIDFAIIRVGGRGFSTGGIYADKKFTQNMEGAINAGLKVGVYFFSQAISAEEAIEEARYTLDQMKGYQVTYPVVFDWEIVSSKDARTYNLNADTLSAAANAFCREVETTGYHPMIYFNSPCGYLKYDLSKIVKYDFWYAQYYSTPTFYYGFDMWQYTSSGLVPGIPTKVDLNLYWTDK